MLDHKLQILRAVELVDREPVRRAQERAGDRASLKPIASTVRPRVRA